MNNSPTTQVDEDKKEISTFEIVKNVLCKNLHLKKEDEEKLNLDTNLVEDLNVDSLDFVEVVMELEQEFNIQIPDDDALKLKTLADLVTYIEQKQDHN